MTTEEAQSKDETIKKKIIAYIDQIKTPESFFVIVFFNHLLFLGFS